MRQDSVSAAKQIEGLADYLSFEQVIRDQLQFEKDKQATYKVLQGDKYEEGQEGELSSKQ